MWPFTSNPPGGLSYRKVDADFVVSAQIAPADLSKIAEAGFKTIVCARPDKEEPGQPDFAVIAKAAKAAGLQAIHIPVSGMVGDAQVRRMAGALSELPTPMYGYCRSGARAGSLYGAAKRIAA